MSNNKLNLLVQFTGVDKLSQNIKNIVGAAGKGSAAIDDMRGEVRLMEKDLARIQRTLSKGGSQNGGLIMAERELSEAIARTNHEIDRQQNRIKKVDNLKSKMSGISQGLGKAGAVGVASLTAPAGLVLASMGNLAERSRDMANSASLAGMGFEDFQRGAHAAASRGIAFDKFGDILKDTQDKIGDFTANGGGEMADFFKNIGPKVGVTAKHFKNLSGADALQLYYNSLAKAGVSQKEMVFYMEAIADEGSGLIPLLKNNGAAMKELGANAAVISSADAVGLKEYSDAQVRLSTETMRLQIALGNSGLIDLMTSLTDKAASAADWFGNLSPDIQKFTLYLGIGAAVAGPILIVLGMLVGALSTLAPMFVAVGSGIALMAGGVASALATVGSVLAGIVGAIGIVPILIAASLAAVGYVIYSNWDAIHAAVMGGVERVKGFFNGLPEWMRNIGSMMMQGLLMSLNPALLVARLLSVAQTGVTAFKNYFGIKSPSRLFMEMGGHINDGLGVGLEKGKSRPVQAIGQMAGAVAGAGAMALTPLALAASADTPTAFARLPLPAPAAPPAAFAPTILTAPAAPPAAFTPTILTAPAAPPAAFAPSILTAPAAPPAAFAPSILTAPAAPPAAFAPTILTAPAAAPIAPAPIILKAPAASPAALSPTNRSAPAPQSGRGDEYHFHIQQQPGEDGEALARRLMDMMKDEQAREQRRQFGDGF